MPRIIYYCDSFKKGAVKKYEKTIVQNSGFGYVVDIWN
ncbi:hypothetical protein DCCM_3805 [Desulfocucumis palustris]|uniref:Uncharacterized protein n=1 Tax=Desulfocucumis palustris TaxID=1898651 RepID=A0A2L2XEM5_9FIRM|nr:hypothetical protein DCCM_3805 [Desulfocucumis palustris]